MRRVGTGALVAGGSSLVPGSFLNAHATPATSSLPGTPTARYSTSEDVTPESDVTSYNNFYEFGTGKGDPARYSKRMQTEPWTIRIEGEVNKPTTYDVDTLRTLGSMEERIYRLRCVEGWSMVIPWIGYSLATVLKRADPTGSAKYVEFVTAQQADAMPGLSTRILDWPYTEALRIDEAMHPLTMLVFGAYGKILLNQNGAPLRIAIPWKYGFKSAKSIVAIRVRKDMPATSWNLAAPHEYGFYANVNPDVPHPRWSQATERRIGSGLFAPRVKTQPFNGYANDVAHLYQGMDLVRFY